MKKIKLIDNKKYRGRGRPRKIDYIYFDNKKAAMVYLIREPINPYLPVPTIL